MSVPSSGFPSQKRMDHSVTVCVVALDVAKMASARSMRSGKLAGGTTKLTAAISCWNACSTSTAR